MNASLICIFLTSIEKPIGQSCPTLCDPMDCSLPGSSVHGIFPGKCTEVGCLFLLTSIILCLVIVHKNGLLVKNNDEHIKLM